MPRLPTRDLYRITAHAKSEMARRGISESQVVAVLSNPGQTLPVREGRQVLQSRLALREGGKQGLLRVFVDIGPDLGDVVTVYWTSKITKYWRVGK